MSTVSVGTIQSNTSDPVTFKNSSGTEIGTLCRAFCNFNGTTVTNPASMTGVNGSFNVSSVLDNGTGDYTVNFTTAMPDANYSASLLTNITSGGTTSGFVGFRNNATTSIRLTTTNAAGVLTDCFQVAIAIFR